MILQSRLPYDPFSPPPLPGIRPLDVPHWAIVDEAYAGQMARREALLAERRSDVWALDPSALPAARELLADVLTDLPVGFSRDGDVVLCPDGRRVSPDENDPLVTLGRLLQEDLCILEPRGDEHVMTGAVLCFPASWTLSEKFMRPLTGIHGPVAEYDANIAKRVQRLFDGIRVGRPIWRFNALWYDSAELFQPRSETAPRAAPRHDGKRFLRSEKQVLRRLPKTGAVVFSIHTFVIAADRVAKGCWSRAG